MTDTSMHVKRCPECDEWTDAKLDNCTHCGFPIHEARRSEIKKRRQVDDIHIPIWRINKDDPFWLKIFKRPVQLVQLALYLIVAFFIYLATAFAH